MPDAGHPKACAKSRAPPCARPRRPARRCGGPGGPLSPRPPPDPGTPGRRPPARAPDREVKRVSRTTTEQQQGTRSADLKHSAPSRRSKQSGTDSGSAFYGTLPTRQTANTKGILAANGALACNTGQHSRFHSADASGAPASWPWRRWHRPRRPRPRLSAAASARRAAAPTACTFSYGRVSVNLLHSL